MAKIDVVMPKMGESVMEGTVLSWTKQVGDEVELDETLLEISTDKVDSEVPSPSAGRVAEIIVEEGDTVDVGTIIARIETDVNAEVDGGADDEPTQQVEHSEPANDEPIAAGGEPIAKDAEPAPRPAEEATASSGNEAVSGGALTDVVMPKMGESVMEGTVLSWAKQIGDEVELDETLLEISTDKVDSEVPSPSAGRLAEILVEEGDTVDVGTVIARISTGAAAASEAAPAEQPPAEQQTTPEKESAPSPEEKGYGMAGQALGGDGHPTAEPAHAGSDEDDTPISRRGESGRFYSPLVRSIAETEGVSMSELEKIDGSGSEGRVTKKDVLDYLEQRSSTPAEAPASKAAPSAPAPQQRSPERPAAPKQQPKHKAPVSQESQGDRVEVVDMDRMRQLIADHMRRSKDTSAHVTSFAEVDVTGLVQHRERHKKSFQEREGVKLTYTPYFLLASVDPLRAHPLMNSSVEGTQILIKKDFHIGIAVAIGTRGLLVPIVRDAGQQNLTGLAHTISDLATRARNKQLLPDELQGGTFTITNVGSLGSLMGTPIISQPQVAILSPGAIVKRPVVVEHPELGDIIAIRHMVYISLSYDHRIIDGAMAASFLSAYRERLEAITVDAELF
ncbi:2-oxoglutarate dehydrogenase, E2 component, dihydrolipoamide succinyltransferase [soil metagenome]